ncbi:unnamed protein product [Ectocarpus sp. 4 AP-2014]
MSGETKWREAERERKSKSAGRGKGQGVVLMMFSCACIRTAIKTHVEVNSQQTRRVPSHFAFLCFSDFLCFLLFFSRPVLQTGHPVKTGLSVLFRFNLDSTISSQKEL